MSEPDNVDAGPKDESDPDVDKPNRRNLPIWLPADVHAALVKRAESRGLRASQHVKTLIFADLGITDSK